MKNIILMIFLLLLSVLNITAQEAWGPPMSRSDSLRAEIQEKIDLLLQDSSRVLHTTEIDREKNDEFRGINDFTDPYNTLSNCILFDVIPKQFADSLNVQGNYYIGVYKNNDILWLSQPYYEEVQLDGDFFGTLDLNNDGLVEILHYWNWTSLYGEEEMYHLNIISWDGNLGTFINDGGLETRLLTEGYYEIVDLNSDGYYEIIADTMNYYSGSDTLEIGKVTFCWNGNTYSTCEDSLGYSTFRNSPWWPFSRANNFEAKVNIRVNKESDMFKYQLQIQNLPPSKQNIRNTYFQYELDSIFYVLPIGSDYNITKLANYDIIGFTITQDSLQLLPGESIIYIYKNKNLPKITNCYLQAPCNWIEHPSNDISTYGLEYDRNVIKNSVKKKIIAPAKLPDQFMYIDFLDTLKTYADSSYSFGWIKDEQTKDKYNNYFNTAKTYLEQGDSSTARAELQKVLTDCNIDSATVLTSEAYALLYFNTEYLVNKLPEGEPGLPVKLEDSQGNLLQGGSLQYYDAGWKDAIDNGDGTFTVQTEKSTVSLKMTYAGGSQQKDNVTVGADTAVFQTSDVTVKLLSSSNTLLDSGFVQYYAGGWQDFGALVNGVAHKELLSKNYTFKMKYAGSEKNHVQNLDTNTTVTFHTVNAEVQLRDSQGNLLPGGFAKYYASGWKDFGEAVNGIAHKELLSRAYTFKIQYGGADMNHVQNLDTNTTVVFNTINVKAELRDSQGNLLDGGTVEYYASGWKDFGEATNGTASKELLPREYTFKMNYGGLNTTKDQDVSANNTVTFNTTLTTVKVKDNQNQPVENAEVLYYGGSWRQIGFTVNGEVTKELLARSITFKAKKDNKEKNKVQDTSENSVVEIILE